MKYKVKRGDTVVVIGGSNRGKRGKILEILKQKQRVVVEGVAIRKKHMKKTQDNPEGSIIEREGSIHYSNVMLVERYELKMSKKNNTQ